MTKLIHAGFARLFKNRLFQLELLGTIAVSIWLCAVNYSPKIQASEPLSIDQVFFTFHQLIGIFYAAAIALFLGDEFSDGTIRNKLVVGHSRGHIYLSNLLIVSVATCMVSLLHCGTTLIVGNLLFEPFTISTTKVVYAELCLMLVACVFSAIATAVSMNCHNKALAAVGEILLMILLAYMGSLAIGRLNEPEMIYDGISISLDGLQLGNLIPNPTYVTGTRRTLLEWIADLLPTGQTLQLFNLDFTRCVRWPFLSVVLYGVISVLGMFRFFRKDIR